MLYRPHAHPNRLRARNSEHIRILLNYSTHKSKFAYIHAFTPSLTRPFSSLPCPLPLVLFPLFDLFLALPPERPSLPAVPGYTNEEGQGDWASRRWPGWHCMH